MSGGGVASTLVAAAAAAASSAATLLRAVSAFALTPPQCIACPPSTPTAPHRLHTPSSPTRVSPARSRMATPVGVGPAAAAAPAVAPAGRAPACSMAASSLRSYPSSASAPSLPPLLDSARMRATSRAVSRSTISPRSDRSAATTHLRPSLPAAATAYTHARRSMRSTGTSCGSSARCDLAMASAYALGAMPPPCAFTQTKHTLPWRCDCSSSPAMRSLCTVIASASIPPMRPVAAPSTPSSPPLQASSSSCSADWQSLSISTRSPAY